MGGAEKQLGWRSTWDIATFRTVSLDEFVCCFRIDTHRLELILRGVDLERVRNIN